MSSLFQKIKNLWLNYSHKDMEKSFAKTAAQFSAESFKSTFVCLAIHTLLIMIPQLIAKKWFNAEIFGGLLGGIILLYISKMVLKSWAQVLAVLVNLTLSIGIFLITPAAYLQSKKNAIFMRGWATASIHVILVCRFPDLLQKIMVTIAAFVIRFVIIIPLEDTPLDVGMLLRQIFIDIFIVYANYANERKDRLVFKQFYQHREELLKFKELLANYFPQSILVLNSTEKEPLFTNKAFNDLFAPMQTTIVDQTEVHLITDDDTCRLNLDDLKVDTGSIREIGAMQPYYEYPENSIGIKDVINDVLGKSQLDKKALTLSASLSRYVQPKSFEIVLTKVKWDSEDAVAVIMNDTTYQEKLTSLKIANANKDQVIATVSHELRTPLNGIIGILQIAEKKVKDLEVIDYLGLCKDNAYLLLGLVNSILDLQQIKQGKLRLNPMRIDIRKLLKSVARLFQFQSQQKDIYLRIEVDDNVPTHIVTDENRLKQILINLIGNALKFTSVGGITVGANQCPRESDMIEVFVADTGIGIKEEDKEKLFKMYGTLKDSAGVNKHGVGLGLMISNILAGILSGDENEQAIHLTSKFGEGSKFKFNIPKNFESKETRILSIHIEDGDKKGQLSGIDTEDDLSIYREAIPNKVHESQISACILDGKANLSAVLRGGSENPLSSPKNTLLFKQKKERRENKSPQNRRGIILIVDDNAFNLLIAENLLNDLNFSVLKAKNGQEAIDILQNKTGTPEYPQYVLMDCQMPIMDGFEATKIIMDMIERGEIMKVLVLALTANNSLEDIKRCYECGMAGHLLKPLAPQALIKGLSELE